MLKWFVSLFKTKEPEPPYKYIIKLKGVEMARAMDLKEANYLIDKIFEEQEGTHRVVGLKYSREQQRKNFRGRFQIYKLCPYCGERDGFCGQC